MTKTEEGGFLLDTHVWIWLLNGEPNLKASKLLPLLEKASIKNLLRIASITIWEIGMLEAKGRLTLPLPCIDWINQGLGAPGIQLIPLTPEIAIDSTRLPGQFHGDPADRIIVATARRLEATLVTHDKKILEYGNSGYVMVKPV